MKVALFAILSTFALIAFADPVADHKVALKEANAQFTAAFEKCEDAATIKARNQCRGHAKTAHTKAVEKADKALAKR